MSDTKRLQLIKTHYFPQRKDFDDKMMLVFRDLDTGKKHYSIIQDPEIEYYINLDEYWTDRPVTYIEPHKVEKVTSLYRNLLKDMAYQLGEEAVQFFNECVQSGKFYYMNRLHLNANVHGSDMDIQDFYISKFLDKYPMPENPHLVKGYFDIEVDTMHFDGFPEEKEAPCPINIMTYFHDENMTAYTFIVRNPENQSLVEFERKLDEFIKDIHSEMLEEDGLDCKFDIRFFDHEIDAICDLFNVINELKPDFIGAWNLRFDALTVINRIKKLGYDELDIMCPQEIPYKAVYYYEDNRNQDPCDKGDTFEVAGYSNWVDQMLIYANLRKTMGKKESYALDAITEEELGKKKLQFGKGENIKNLPWKNFYKFAKYNIRDVILLHLLEEKIQDIDMLYNIAYTTTRTRITKALKKTISLRNLANYFYTQQGYIMSNNRNMRYGAEDEPSEKFRGAFVADPNLNEPLGMEIGGKRSKFIFENVIDMDLTSLYPTIILALNIDSATQFGRLVLEDENGENIAYQLFDTLSSRDPIAIGTKWLNLPTISEIIEDLEEELEILGYDFSKGLIY